MSPSRCCRSVFFSKQQRTRIFVCRCASRHHRAVRKDRHEAGLAMKYKCSSASSCSQTRHTRWPATNSLCWCAIVRSEKGQGTQCKELPMLRHRSAVGKQVVTHQLWRTKSGDSNNLPLLFDATWLLVAPRCASKKHDPPYLFYNPLKQPNLGCNSGSKIGKKGSQY